jgi:hypothetical protein
MRRFQSSGRQYSYAPSQDSRAEQLGERRYDGVEYFGAGSRVALGGARARVAEQVAQREAVEAFARERACKGMALVVKAKASRDAGDRFGGLEVALDRAPRYTAFLRA